MSPAPERIPPAENTAQSGADDRELREIDQQLRDPKVLRQATFMVEVALGEWGFGTGPFDGQPDPRTRDAVRRYQVIRNLPPSGELNAVTLKSMMADLKKWEDFQDRVMLPMFSAGFEGWGSGFIMARGTWTIVGGKQAFPVQTAQIVCDREAGTCTESIAMLMDDYLSVDSNDYEIERWDEHEITTRPVQSAVCVRYTLRFARAAKSVTGTRLRTSDRAGCEHVDPELHLKLVDGLEARKELQEKRHALTRILLQADLAMFDESSSTTKPE